ncbi:hypothetical protein JCGZ_04978 [Jatropha curcas]|uniref:Uncharacterized protein n=1 Tax=Jatropha curcas TaxID=180498 RepID=A0A067KRI6_JATCU|nr:hypothetical protein JCGZ_04978 [Jatropha curcas]
MEVSAVPALIHTVKTDRDCTYCEQLLGLLCQPEQEGESEEETEASSSTTGNRRRRKIRQEEARRDLPIEGCRGTPAPSAYARDERERRREAGIRCDVDAMARRHSAGLRLSEKEEEEEEEVIRVVFEKSI